MPPKNHVPTRFPQGYHQRLLPNLLALQMPHYLPASIWLLKHAPRISYN